MGMPIMYTIDKGERVYIMKKTLLFFGLILSMLTVSAEENVLQSIEIIPVKDTYNIVLNLLIEVRITKEKTIVENYSYTYGKEDELGKITDLKTYFYSF